MLNTEARLETRLHARAKRRSLMLRKCRCRNPDALGFGGFMLIDAETNGVVLGSYPYPYSATLEDIDASLRE